MTKFPLVFTMLFLGCMSSKEDKKDGSDSIVLSAPSIYQVATQRHFDTLSAPEYQNNTAAIGLGLCQVSKEVFLLFEDTLLRPDSIALFNPEYSGVMPLFFKPDYGIFYLVVLNKTANYYLIQRNISARAFLPVSEVKKFIEWPEFLVNAVAVENINWEQNPLYKEKKSVPLKSSFDRNSPLHVIEISENWAKVRNEKNQEAWLQWRDENDLLLRVLLLM